MCSVHVSSVCVLWLCVCVSTTQPRSDDQAGESGWQVSQLLHSSLTSRFRLGFGAQSFVHFSAQTQLCSKKIIYVVSVIHRV